MMMKCRLAVNRRVLTQRDPVVVVVGDTEMRAFSYSLRLREEGYTEYKCRTRRHIEEHLMLCGYEIALGRNVTAFVFILSCRASKCGLASPQETRFVVEVASPTAPQQIYTTSDLLALRPGDASPPPALDAATAGGLAVQFYRSRMPSPLPMTIGKPLDDRRATKDAAGSVDRRAGLSLEREGPQGPQGSATVYPPGPTHLAPPAPQPRPGPPAVAPPAPPALPQPGPPIALLAPDNIGLDLSSSEIDFLTFQDTCTCGSDCTGRCLTISQMEFWERK
eukprot:TRINITY_DN21762_c0_g2_i1.p1 TRINITY_DN21762_c0_g2~~TRINITY_DN21762_c0_g2_i1.p1  ORF type:complete len:278 (-),score=7.66 TRINITY_DN21762_c0_g2_i1:28-861(-)